MRLLAGFLALCLFGCGGSSGSGSSNPSQDYSEPDQPSTVSSEPPSNPDQPLLIYIVNDSSRTTREVQLATAAVQRQLDDEVHRHYSIGSTLVLADPVRDDSVRVYLQDRYQEDPNAGYHDGKGTAWVATELEGWSEILSHEVIEMQLGNICDPVQRPYGSPPVENFLLPSGTGFLESQGL